MYHQTGTGCTSGLSGNRKGSRTHEDRVRGLAQLPVRYDRAHDREPDDAQPLRRQVLGRRGRSYCRRNRWLDKGWWCFVQGKDFAHLGRGSHRSHSDELWCERMRRSRSILRKDRECASRCRRSRGRAGLNARHSLRADQCRCAVDPEPMGLNPV